MPGQQQLGPIAASGRTLLKPENAIDNKFSKGIIDSNGLGMLGRRLASVNTGAFRFFRGTLFQPPRFYLARWIPSKLSFENIIGPIWLFRIQYLSADGPSNKIRYLETCRVAFFTEMYNFKLVIVSGCIPAAYPAKLKLKCLLSSFFSSAFKQNMRSAGSASSATQLKGKSVPIRNPGIYGKGFEGSKYCLLRFSFRIALAISRKGAVFNQSVQIVYERRPALLVLQKIENPFCLSDIMLVQNYLVMAEMFELEPNDIRRSRFSIGCLVNQTKRQHEHGVRRINGRQARDPHFHRQKRYSRRVMAFRPFLQAPLDRADWRSWWRAVAVAVSRASNLSHSAISSSTFAAIWCCSARGEERSMFGTLRSSRLGLVRVASN